VFLLASITVALGAIGHALRWEGHVHAAVSADAHIIQLLALIWYWTSGSMLTCGLLLIWAWWRMLKGARGLLFIPGIIAAFYFVGGVYGALQLGGFFTIFIWQAMLLAISAWGLQSTQPPQAQAAG
jgi:hypothetical protein